MIEPKMITVNLNGKVWEIVCFRNDDLTTIVNTIHKSNVEDDWAMFWKLWDITSKLVRLWNKCTPLEKEFVTLWEYLTNKIEVRVKWK